MASSERSRLLVLKGASETALSATDAADMRARLRAIVGPELVKGSLRRPAEILADIIDEAAALGR